MAQWRTDLNEYKQPHNVHLFEVNMIAGTDGTLISNTNPMAVIGNTPNYRGIPVLTVDDDTVQHTSKNRRKVSNYEIIDYASFQSTTQTDVWDQKITGTANAVFDQYKGMVQLSVGSSTGDQIIRQTKRVVRYIPGRQSEVTMSVIFGQPTTGVRRRFGIFDDLNGAFFEDAGDGEYYVVCRRNTAGGPVEVRIPRSQWNMDKLDGTGSSGITANPLAIQLMVIEYEWYGAGQVEFKFIIDNNAYSVHQFNHANIDTTPWASTAFLPVRIELTNVAGTAGTHTCFQGSHSVLQEGQFGKIGSQLNASSPITGKTLTDANVFYPIVSIRLKSTDLNGVVIPTSFTSATLDNTNIFFRIIRNATLTGGTWVSVGADSHVEYNITQTAITSGEILLTGFITGGSQGNIYRFDDEITTQLARRTVTNLGDTSDTFTVAIAATGSNKDGFASLAWTEVR